MRKIWIALLLTSALLFQGSFYRSTRGGPTPAPLQSVQDRTRLLQKRLAQEGERFRSGRKLLKEKGVPFDPDILLNAHWRKLLASKLSQMPEMSVTRRGGGRLRGAQLADTLILPEKIELTGDAVILVKRLLFTGTEVLIKGNHDVHIFSVESVGAVAPDSAGAAGVGLNQKVGYAKAPGAPQVTEQVNLTIDTSAAGRDEWLKAQEARSAPARRSGARMLKAGYAAGLPLQDEDASGAKGTDGAAGSAGSTGNQGADGGNGINGSCSTGGSSDGAAGANGNDGWVGGDGGAGGNGTAGSNGGSITFDISGTMWGYYSFVSRGGDGGNGGNGGSGGTIGGTYPNTFSGTISADVSRGRGGFAGFGGNGGVFGSAGSGGTGGAAATANNCPSDPSAAGANGSAGSGALAGGSGFAGSVGFDGNEGTVSTHSRSPRSCDEVIDNYQDEFSNCMSLGGAVWYDMPDCRCSDPSPIIIDALDNGYALTSRADGVEFDINNDGVKDRLPWTARGADELFLALDRSGNGAIDNGRELFGNFTPQPDAPDANGFLALAEFDKEENGGNGDGVIDGNDAVFDLLRLWQDANHNGVSEPEELHRLADYNVASLALKYSRKNRTDQYGNQFRYRARVNSTGGASAGLWAYDVFFTAP